MDKTTKIISGSKCHLYITITYVPKNIRLCPRPKDDGKNLEIFRDGCIKTHLKRICDYICKELNGFIRMHREEYEAYFDDFGRLMIAPCSDGKPNYGFSLPYVADSNDEYRGVTIPDIFGISYWYNAILPRLAVEQGSKDFKVNVQLVKTDFWECAWKDE